MTSYLRVRNWEKWQSYRSDRGRPPWVKVWRRLLLDASFVSLSDAERGHLVCLWILAADHDGVIPNDKRTLRKLCHLDKAPNIQRLIETGWLELDASVTPERRQDDASVTPPWRPSEVKGSEGKGSADTRAPAREACPSEDADPEDTGDPGDGTLEPEADSAADMDRSGARRSPSAERKPEAVPTQRPAGDRGARGQAAAPPATRDAPAQPPVPPTTAPAPANPADDDPSPAHTAAYRLAEYLHDLDPAITAPPIIDPWAMQLSRLHHRDKRAWDEIDQVMHWAFKVSDWWPPRLLNPANFVRHYAQLRAQWQAEQTAALKAGEPKAAPESPETMRSLYSALEYELSDGGVDDARSWITRQKPDLHKRLTARLDKLVSAQGAR